MSITEEIVTHYYNVLANEIKNITDSDMSEREKLCAIIRIANTVNTYYGQNMMAHLNFADIDMSDYEIDGFTQYYPFP